MSAVTQPSADGQDRVALRIEDRRVAEEVAEILAARGIAVDHGPSQADAAHVTVAYAKRDTISLDLAASLEEPVREAALSRRPFVVLSPAPSNIEEAAALGYLRSAGAVLCNDPATWIETLVLISRMGLPLGPRSAIVAEPSSLLAASAAALAHEQALRRPTLKHKLEAADGEGHDAVLVDVALAVERPRHRIGGALVVPVAVRAELAGDTQPCLVDLRHALAAVEVAGSLALRLDAGLGPGPDRRPSVIDADLDNFSRQLGKIGNVVGDHETKLLLSCYGVAVTRQAVATTPSAATRVAKKAGYPVDVKAWDADMPTEADGGTVESNLATAADVRRAFTALTHTPGGGDAAVIVREHPPTGRELRIRFQDLPEVGWTAIATTPGRGIPVAAPVPLSPTDAEMLANLVAATRSTDREIRSDRVAEILTRASYLVWDNDDTLESLDLARIIASTEDDSVVVVDARCRRRPRPR